VEFRRRYDAVFQAEKYRCRPTEVGFIWFHHKFVISEVPYEFSGFYMYIYNYDLITYIYIMYIVYIYTYIYIYVAGWYRTMVVNGNQGSEMFINAVCIYIYIYSQLQYSESDDCKFC
jgi:hypothetical protein